MRQKRKILIGLTVCLSVGLFPVPTHAVAYGEDNISITFTQRQSPPPTTNIERDNVLPMTMTYVRSDTSLIRRLPQTGESINQLQIIGIGCLLVSFWLFLFLRLRKEAADD